ncbi:MAG: NAD(+) diphosphatase [Chloroflexi bacterium]|nr:NAD(+) diphosphatase [Chloroflexota bacterium]
MDRYNSSLNYFITNAIDRVSDKRRDDEWLAAILEDETTRFVPVWQSKNFFDSNRVFRPVFLSPDDVQCLIHTAESVVLLGMNGDGAYFAIGLPSEKDSELTKLGRFRNLRQAALLLDEHDCALLAYAKAMVYWHHRHRFCGDCGSPTTSVAGGSLRVCTDEQCGQQHFPRTDPAIIVLVTSGDRCLMGRQPSWPKGLYSTLAGFVEPGESLEAAVIREVREETGVEVAGMRYFASQPWPFPSSLMLGFMAQAASEAIRVDQHELENARWFTRKEIRDMLTQSTLRIPFKLAISYHLIENWFDAGDLGPLKDIVDT